MELRGLYPPMENCLLLLENRGSFFVDEDRAFQLAEIGSLAPREAHLANHVIRARSAAVALRGDGGVIAGEVDIEIHRVRRLIDHVAGGSAMSKLSCQWPVAFSRWARCAACRRRESHASPPRAAAPAAACRPGAHTAAPSACSALQRLVERRGLHKLE